MEKQSRLLNRCNEKTKWPWENFGDSRVNVTALTSSDETLNSPHGAVYWGFGFTKTSQTCLKWPWGSSSPLSDELIAAVPQDWKGKPDRNPSRGALEAETGSVRGDATEEATIDCNSTVPSCGVIWNSSLKAAAVGSSLNRIPRVLLRDIKQLITNETTISVGVTYGATG